MDVRIVGVPMIDRDPIEIGAEIARHVVHQLAREGAQVRHVTGVLGRDDEAEMVSVLFAARGERSEEHTSELQSLMRISYAVFCLKKKQRTKHNTQTQHHRSASYLTQVQHSSK